MWAQAARTISSRKPQHAPVLYSTLFLARGVGCVFGPILVSAIYNPQSGVRSGLNGSGYGLYDSGPLCLFVGSSLLVSALVAFCGGSTETPTSMAEEEE